MLEMMTGSLLKKISEPGLEIDPEVFQKLIASDGVSGDYFGWSVAVSADGSTLVIGASCDDDKGVDSGSAYIFTKQSNGSYLETQKLVATDGAANDYFGDSVVVSGDGSTIVIGAPWHDDKPRSTGSVYIFTKQANGNYLETQKLIADDGAIQDYFGDIVAITTDGSTVIVGVHYDDDKGTDSGSAYIFTKQANGSYLQTQKLTASDGAATDFFGYSVTATADGSTLVIGASCDDDKGTDSGSAYVFTKQTSGSYLQTQKLVATDGAAQDYFGDSVVVSGDGSTIVIGAYGDDDKGSESGSAYVFTKQANGSYLQTQKLVATDGALGDRFGWSVVTSEDGSTIVIGAYGDDGYEGYDFGSVYVFTKQANGSYLETQKLVTTDGAADDYFGYSVAVSNSSAVISAYKHLNKGAVYVY